MLPIPNQIVIAGLNIHSLISAFALRQAYSKDRTKILIIGQQHQDANKGALVVDQQLNKLLNSLGHSESDWMSRTAATFKLRSHYIGWSAKPFSLAQNCAVDIYHHPLLMELTKLKRQSYDIDINIDEFFFASALAERDLSPHGKDFPFPIDYQYQVDSQKLVTLFLSLVTEHDIHIIEQDIETLERDKSGNIKQVETAEKAYLADYFLDCSEFEQILISNMSGHAQEQIKHIRIHDRVLTARVKTDKVLCEARNISYEGGFVKQLSTHGEMVFEYHFSSKFVSEEVSVKALQQFIQKCGFDSDIELSLQGSAEHIVKHPWINNCLAIGKACGFSRPAEDFEISNTFFAINCLLKSIRSEGDVADIVALYNQNIKVRFAYSLAFSDTLLLMNERRDSPYWMLPQDPSLLPALSKPILAQWGSGQDLKVDPVMDIIGVYGWYSLLTGLGQFPRDNLQKHPQMDAIQENIDDTHRKLTGCCLNFPSHISSLSTGDEHVE